MIRDTALILIALAAVLFAVHLRDANISVTVSPGLEAAAIRVVKELER